MKLRFDNINDLNVNLDYVHVLLLKEHEIAKELYAEDISDSLYDFIYPCICQMLQEILENLSASNLFALFNEYYNDSKLKQKSVTELQQYSVHSFSDLFAENWLEQNRRGKQVLNRVFVLKELIAIKTA